MDIKCFEDTTRNLSVYEQFHHYDFDNDQSYQKGLQKIKKLPDFLESDILKSKIFYFSRSFHSVNVDDYKKWLEEHPDETIGTIGKVKCERKLPSTGTSSKCVDSETVVRTNKTDDDQASSGVLNETSVSDTVTCTLSQDHLNTNIGRDLPMKSLHEINTNSEQSSYEESVTQQCLINNDNIVNSEFSLADVSEYIEKGLKLPGILDLHIRPLDIEPQPSIIQRKLKPWEK